MKKRIIAAALCLTLLLAACGSPAQSPSATPTPAQSGGVNVTVHWDVLTPKPENIAGRWYEGYTDELIPSDEYGELVPYIGGETSNEYMGTSWNYGLATRDGVIVTDPVYLEVNSTDGGSALVLRTAVPIDAPAENEWTPRHDDRYGLAAMTAPGTQGRYTPTTYVPARSARYFSIRRATSLWFPPWTAPSFSAGGRASCP